MAKRSPTVRERRLARALRHLREEAGLTIEDVAEKLEISPSTVSRMETAQVGVRPRDLRYLLDMYGVTGGRRDDFLQIARERRVQPWWQEYRDLHDELPGLEDDAASIRQYTVQLVPGLLQTEAYARTILTTVRPGAKSTEIDRRLKLRLDRQELLTREDAPQYWAVLDEAVLHRRVGGSTIMHEQLGRLIDAAGLSSVNLQVLPFDSGAHPGMDGDFTILQYREPADPDVVYLESTAGDMYYEKSDVTHRYNEIFDHLRAAAQNPGESLRTLGTIESLLLEEAERS